MAGPAAPSATGAPAAASPAAAAADEDDRLMRAFAAGQAQAFEALYARHEAGLYRFVRRLLGREAARHGDEVFQDTWLRVVQSRAQWSPQGATFRTWLFTLAHHRAVDVLRRSGREQPWEGGTEGGQDAAHDAGPPPHAPAGEAWQGWPAAAVVRPEDAAFWRRAGERLLACLAELPAGQRAAFLLHHDEGFSVADVAQSLGLNFETAKTRLRYALGRLRLCMGAYLEAGT